MMTSNIKINNSNIMIQAIALKKSLIRLDIEQTEDEILSFEDALINAIRHPEQIQSIPIENIKEKIKKLNQLRSILAELEQ